MTSARDEILARVRTALGPNPAPVTVLREYRRSSTMDNVIELFEDRLRDYGATVVHVTPDGVAAAVAEQVRGRVRVAPGLPWLESGPDGPHVGGVAVEVDDGGPAAELDAVDTAVTGAAAACAVTGTIVLDGSPDQGRRALTLVPDRHVCVVHSGQIVGAVPELLARLNPRAPLTFVSGPSATADIELQRVKGVHGPRQLVVIIVADTTGQ
ncbi:MAG: LUD domain-containing protein [Micromonosporaceae bacterium]|nr:LUD domain-containing protein [Micromonosporaceae bacterium]